MPVISLYWFAAQQKKSLFDAKFSVESNGLVASFYKEQKVA